MKSEKFAGNYIEISFSRRKHRHGLVDELKKQSNRVLIDKELATKVIIDFIKTAAHKFRTTLGFKQCDIILTEDQSVLRKKVHLKIQTKYIVLGYRID